MGSGSKRWEKRKANKSVKARNYNCYLSKSSCRRANLSSLVPPIYGQLEALTAKLAQVDGRASAFQ